MKYVLDWVCAFLTGAASTTGRGGLGRRTAKRIGENMNKDNTLGFFVGFSVGVGMALLLAPKSGANTRSMVAKTAREGSDYLKQQASDLSDTTADLIGKVRKQAARAAEDLGDVAGPEKQRLHESAV